MNLFLMSSLVPLISAFIEGRKAGWLGTSIGLVVGLTASFVCFWGLWALLIWIPRRLGLQEQKDALKFQRFQMVFGYVSLFAAIVWVAALSFSGYCITKLLINLGN